MNDGFSFVPYLVPKLQNRCTMIEMMMVDMMVRQLAMTILRNSEVS